MQRSFDATSLDGWPYDDGLKAAIRITNTKQMMINMPQWDINYRTNMCRKNKRCIAELFEKSEGPAIICGAGPSLSKLIKLVKMIGYSTPTICVDAAYEKLRGWGFVPEYVVSRDSSPNVLKMLENIGSETSVILSLYCDPEVGNHCVERTNIYWYGPINPFSPHVQCLREDYGTEYQNIMDLPIVGVQAVDVCAQMGFNEIILVGNDLGWHTSQEALDNPRGGELLEVTGMSDTTMYSYNAYVGSIDSFKSMKYVYPGITFKDASGGLLSKIYERVEV